MAKSNEAVRKALPHLRHEGARSQGQEKNQRGPRQAREEKGSKKGSNYLQFKRKSIK